MALKAGTTSDYTGSMAEAIEQAFRKEWPNVMKGMDLPAKASPDLQLLFVAVAQGVVGYLKSHASSFKVTVTPSGGHTHSTTVTIETV